MYDLKGSGRNKKIPGSALISPLAFLEKEAVRSYYLIWVLIFGAGIYSGIRIIQYRQVPVYVYYMIIAAMFLLLAGSSYSFVSGSIFGSRKAGRKKIIFLVFIPAMFLFLCGILIPQASIKKAISVVEGNNQDASIIIQLEGRVSSHPEMDYGNICFEMVIRSSSNEGLGRGDIINVIVKGSIQDYIQRDDILRIKGRASVSGTGPVLRANSWSIETIKEKDFTGRLFQLRQRFYDCISKAFSHYLGYEYAPLASALILGDRTGISGRQYDIFKKSGTAHLMAISGMHISFLAAIIYMLLEKVFKRSLLLLSMIIILLFYNFILGPGASVMRATIWVLAAASARTWKREFKPAYVLCISFILLLIACPGFIDSAGFWLSFSAMTGIVFIYPAVRDLLRAAGSSCRVCDNHIISTIIITISVQLICGPLLIYYFGDLPLVSPLSNLFMMPLFYVLILLLFSSSAISIIWPPAAGAMLKLAPILFRVFCGTARFFSDPRFPSLQMENITAGGLFIYYFIIFTIFLIIRAGLHKRFDF